MNGIYLTEQGKQEIEAKITQLEKADVFYRQNASRSNPNYASNSKELEVYKEILSSTTILPVEESFYTVENKIKHHCGQTGCSKDGAVLREYPNGVIIKPKE